MLKEEAHQLPRHGYQEPRHPHVNNYQKMLDVPAFIPKPGILRLYLYKPSYLGFLISETWLTVPYSVVMGNNGVIGHKVSS